MKKLYGATLTAYNNTIDGDVLRRRMRSLPHPDRLYRNDGSQPFGVHTSTGTGYDRTDCTACHTHDAGFYP